MGLAGPGIPLTRLTPWYPGQLGIAGSDNTLGLRIEPQARVWYVDGGHPLANDANDGTNPDEPLATIQEAIDRNNATINWAATPPYEAMNWIIIAPGQYAENLGAGGDLPYYCRIVGLGLATGNTTDVCVDVHPAAGSALAGTGLGCHWYNVRFEVDTAHPVVDLDVCNSCVFENCMFTDGNPGLATVGCDMTDANSSWWVNCRFTGNSNPLTIGLRSTGDFYSCMVLGCQIAAVTTGIDLHDADLCGNAVIAHNYIAKPVTGILDDVVGQTLVVNNWITATDAINHADATMVIANHVQDAGVGAVEAAGTD